MDSTRGSSEQAGVGSSHTSSMSQTTPFRDSTTSDSGQASMQFYLSLKTAVVNGDVSTLKTLLKRDTDINVTYGDTHATLLMMAVDAGFDEIVDVLMSVDIDVDMEDFIGHTALMHAAIHGNEYATSRILMSKALVDAQDDEGNTALMFACRYGYDNIAQLLLQHNASLKKKNKTGECPLLISAKYGNVKVADLLIRKKAHVDCVDNSKKSALQWAVWGNHVDLAGLLMKHNVNVNYYYDNFLPGKSTLHNSLDISEHLFRNGSRSSLMLACIQGNYDIVDMLLGCKADVSYVDQHHRTCIYYAIKNNDVEMIELLIQCDANVHHLDYEDVTPLMVAAQEGFFTVCEMLLFCDSEINLVDRNEGKSALMYAVMNNHLNIVQLLLTNHAKVTVCDHSKRNALMLLCSSHDNVEMMQLLIQHKCSVKDADEYGHTPLITAAMHGRHDLVQYLCTNTSVKVNVNAVDEHKWSALSYAIARGHLSCCRSLVAAKANLDLEDVYHQNMLNIASYYDSYRVLHYILSGHVLLEHKCGKLTPYTDTTLDDLEHLTRSGRDRGESVVSAVVAPITTTSVDKNSKDHAKRLISIMSYTAHTDNYGNTPLLSAFINGSEISVRMLLQHEVNCVNWDREGRTALMLACMYMPYVSDAYGKTFTRRDRTRQRRNPSSGVGVSVRGGGVDREREEKDHRYGNSSNSSSGSVSGVGTDASVDVDGCVEDPYAYDSYYHCIDALLAHIDRLTGGSQGRHSSSSNSSGSGKGSAVITAGMGLGAGGVGMGVNEAVVRYINTQDKAGKTALMYAAERGRYDVVRRILMYCGYQSPFATTAPASAEASASSFSSSFLASPSSSSSIPMANTTTISPHAISCVSVVDQYGRNALAYSVCQRSQRVISELVHIQKKIDFSGFLGELEIPENGLVFGNLAYISEVRNEEFRKACDRNDPSLCESLLSAHADIDSIDIHTQRTGLICAAINGHIEVVRLLLENKGDVCVCDRDGRTCLMWAVIGGYEDIAKALVEHDIAQRQLYSPEFTSSGGSGKIPIGKIYASSGISGHVAFSGSVGHGTGLHESSLSGIETDIVYLGTAMAADGNSSVHSGSRGDRTHSTSTYFTPANAMFPSTSHSHVSGVSSSIHSGVASGGSGRGGDGSGGLSKDTTITNHRYDKTVVKLNLSPIYFDDNGAIYQQHEDPSVATTLSSKHVDGSSRRETGMEVMSATSTHRGGSGDGNAGLGSGDGHSAHGASLDASFTNMSLSGVDAGTGTSNMGTGASMGMDMGMGVPMQRYDSHSISSLSYMGNYLANMANSRLHTTHIHSNNTITNGMGVGSSAVLPQLTNNDSISVNSADYGNSSVFLPQRNSELLASSNMDLDMGMGAGAGAGVGAVSLLNMTDVDNRTALTLAASHGNKNMVKLLLSYDCDMNVVSFNNETALTVAIKQKHTKVVKKLLEHIPENSNFPDCGDILFHSIIEPLEYDDRKMIVKLLQSKKVLNSETLAHLIKK